MNKWIISLAVLWAGICLGGEPLAAADAGRTITRAPGEEITIQLKGNPTTGYVWEQSECTAEVLQPVGEPEYHRETDRIGAGGTYTFRFKTLAPGTGKIHLIYHRTFEKDVPPIEEFSLDVICAEAPADTPAQP